MEYVGINTDVVIPEPCNGNVELPMLLSNADVSVAEMLTQAPTCPTVVDTASEKSAVSDKSGNRRSLKRKHASNQGSRKGLKAKKTKDTDVYSSGESPAIGCLNNGQMPCTPASSSSPGDSMSERKLVGSSVDNIYEFTEQEETHKLPDETLLKRKRSTRNYGKPKNRWLLESEMKNISEQRQRSYNENQEMELSGESEAMNISNDTPPGGGVKSVGVDGPAGITPKCPKLRINRNPSKNGAYECHLIEQESVDNTQPPSVVASSYRTDCGDIFSVGDVVWAKLVGWPWWPAKLQSFYVNADGHHTGTAQVMWFNWDQISYVKCEKLHHFLAAYNSKLDKRRRAGGYKAAIDQALKEAWHIKRQQSANCSSTYDDNDDDDYNEGDDESNDSGDDVPVAKQNRGKNLISEQKHHSQTLVADSAASTKLSQLKNIPFTEVPSVNFPQRTETAATYVSPTVYSKELVSPKSTMDHNKAHKVSETVESSSSKESALESRTSSLLVPEDFHGVHAQYNFFDTNSSVAVDNFDTFEAAAERNDEIVGPLVDIGPNLNFLNPKSLSTCIPSFSDDDELDMRPVFDPASIENV